MTRRAHRRHRVLSVNAYIHRATLGLPKDERLDAAAELRAHLLERIAEHEAQGFSREEAEYLAVKGMGEPSVTNRELLGHFLTTPLGWAVLAALIVGWAGWQLTRQKSDIARLPLSTGEMSGQILIQQGILPTIYYGYTLTPPAGTQLFYIAWLTAEREQISWISPDGGTISTIKGYFGWPTWQPKWATVTPLPKNAPQNTQFWRNYCPAQQPVHVAFYAETNDSHGGRGLSGMHGPTGTASGGLLWCSGLAKSEQADWGVSAPYFQPYVNDSHLSLNRLQLEHWTPLEAIGTINNVTGKRPMNSVLLVMPSRQTDVSKPPPTPLPQLTLPASDEDTIRLTGR